MKEEKKQASEHSIVTPKVMYLLAMVSHFPLFDNEGTMFWNAKKVPVGRRFARLAAPGRALWVERGIAMENSVLKDSKHLMGDRLIRPKTSVL